MTALHTLTRPVNHNTNLVTILAKGVRYTAIEGPPTGKIRVAGIIPSSGAPAFLNPFAPALPGQVVAFHDGVGPSFPTVIWRINDIHLLEETMGTGTSFPPMVFLRPGEDLTIEMPVASAVPPPVSVFATYFDVTADVLKVDRVKMATGAPQVIIPSPVAARHLPISGLYDGWSATIYTSDGAPVSSEATEELRENGVVFATRSYLPSRVTVGQSYFATVVLPPGRELVAYMDILPGGVTVYAHTAYVVNPDD